MLFEGAIKVYQEQIKGNESEAEKLRSELQNLEAQKGELETLKSQLKGLGMTGEKALQAIHAFLQEYKENGNKDEWILNTFWGKVDELRYPTNPTEPKLTLEKKEIESVKTENKVETIDAPSSNDNKIETAFNKQHRDLKRKQYFDSLADWEIEAIVVYYGIESDTREWSIKQFLDLPMSVADFKNALANSPLTKTEDGQQVDGETEYLIKQITKGRSKKEIVKDAIANGTEQERTNPNRKIETEELYNLTAKQQKYLLKYFGTRPANSKQENAWLLADRGLTLQEVENRLNVKLYPSLVKRLNTLQVA